MKNGELFGAGPPRQRPGLRRREMPPLQRERAIDVEKCRFA
jgi:hypothetical protein